MDPLSSAIGELKSNFGFTEKKERDEKPEKSKENYIPNSEGLEKPAQIQIASRTTGLYEEGNQSNTLYPISQYGAETIIETLSPCFQSDVRKRAQMGDMVKKAVSEGTLSMEALVDQVSALCGEDFKVFNQKLMMENIIKMHQNLLEQPSTLSEESAGNDSVETGIKALEQVGAYTPLTGYKKDILELEGWVSELKDMDRQCPNYGELLDKVNKRIKQLVDLSRNVRLDIGHYKNIVEEVDIIITSAQGSVCFDDLTKNLGSVSISELNGEFSLNSWIAINLTTFSRKVRQAMEQSGLPVKEIQIADCRDPHDHNRNRPALALNYSKDGDSSYLYYYFSGRSSDGSRTELSKQDTERDHLFDMGAITERNHFNRHNKNKYRIFTGTAICEDDFSQSILSIYLLDQDNNPIKSATTKNGDIDINQFYEGAENLKTCHKFWHSYLKDMMREALERDISSSRSRGFDSGEGVTRSAGGHRGFGATRSAVPVFQSTDFSRSDVDSSDSDDDSFIPYASLYEEAEHKK